MYKLEDISVKVNVEDMILALMMALDTSYDSFIISLDSAPMDKLTLEHVVNQLLNEEVQRDNKQAEKGGNEKAAKDQVYMVKNDQSCWRCGKPGQIKVFCKEVLDKPKKDEKAMHGRPRWI